MIFNYLLCAFIEAADPALRFCAEAQRVYKRKKARTNTTLACKALAHTPACAWLHIR